MPTDHAANGREDQAIPKGQTANPVTGNDPEFFDAMSGEPVVWYARSGTGSIEIFDLMGFHPRNGDELLPVTREMVEFLEIAEREDHSPRSDARRSRQISFFRSDHRSSEGLVLRCREWRSRVLRRSRVSFTHWRAAEGHYARCDRRLEEGPRGRRPEEEGRRGTTSARVARANRTGAAGGARTCGA